MRENAILYILPDAILFEIFSFFISEHGVDMTSFYSVQSVCLDFKYFINSPIFWSRTPTIFLSGELNIENFKLIKKKNQGTEGRCYHVIRRSNMEEVALKRARVYPQVPIYY